MIDKTFIEKIEDIVKKNCETRQINDITYSVDALKLNSLQSLVDYIKTNRDNLDYNNLTIVVETHNRVKLISNIYGKKRNRDTFIITEINPDKLEFGRYYDMETFMIKLTSLFIENDDRQFLLQHLSKVVIEDNITLADDGISQNISTKTGVSGALKEIQSIEPFVCLKPFRTFLEVDQPESQFLFRMQKGSPNGVICGLFEADGGMWVYAAKQSIKDFLIEKIWSPEKNCESKKNKKNQEPEDLSKEQCIIPIIV